MHRLHCPDTCSMINMVEQHPWRDDNPGLIPGAAASRQLRQLAQGRGQRHHQQHPALIRGPVRCYPGQARPLLLPQLPPRRSQCTRPC